MNVSADDLSEISAKSAIVIDGETGDVLFEKNAYERRQMASTTKIMSVLLVLESGEDLGQAVRGRQRSYKGRRLVHESSRW